MKPYLIILILSLMVCVGYSQETNKVTKIVSDVAMMSSNKVDVSVIEAYIKNVDLVPVLTPYDIVYLSQHNVTNTVIQTLISKNGETKKIVTNYVAKREYRESYDFFYEMYLLPRARYYSYKRFQ